MLENSFILFFLVLGAALDKRKMKLFPIYQYKFSVFVIQVTVSLGFVFNTLQYSGMIFQVMVDSKKKHHSPDILAAGGCYDKLVQTAFKSILI